MAGGLAGALRRLLAGSPERAGRRLARDAGTILANARGTYRDELLRDIAARTATLRDQSAVHADSGTATRISRLRALHREARSAGDQVALTALTFAIIDLEASALGQAGAPARATIAAFVEQSRASSDAGSAGQP